MVLRETVTFVFPGVLMFPSTLSQETSGLEENKTNQFPLWPYIKCFVIYLDLPLNNHVLLYSACSNNSAIISQSGYILIWSEARDKESTNQSARFLEWKSKYLTTKRNPYTNMFLIKTLNTQSASLHPGPGCSKMG